MTISSSPSISAVSNLDVISLNDI